MVSNFIYDFGMMKIVSTVTDDMTGFRVMVST